MKASKVWAIIPAYNEEANIQQVIRFVHAHGNSPNTLKRCFHFQFIVFIHYNIVKSMRTFFFKHVCSGYNT